MERKVVFREYTPPTIDEETGESERGDFIQSFSERISGNTLLEISKNAELRAKELSDDEAEVRVFEIPI